VLIKNKELTLAKQKY